MSALSRREFLRRLAALAGGLMAGELLAGCAPAVSPTPAVAPTSASTPASAATATVAPAAPTTAAATAPATAAATATSASTTGSAYLAVAHGPQPAEITRRAIAALGGIERFVKAGADVIIKPNICSASHSFEYAATTNPEVVATLVQLCREAGAKRVRVMDQAFSGTSEAAYAISGIADAVKAVGGEMEIMAPMRFREVDIPKGKDLKRWSFYGAILDADVVINVPIAKDHGDTILTLGGKNIMGTVDNRSAFHRNLGQRIADAYSRVMPALTVIDAVRILTAHGPTGGNLADVKLANTVIASADVVAADSYATTNLFGLKPTDIGYITAMADMNIGTMDLSAVKVEEIQVG